MLHLFSWRNAWVLDMANSFEDSPLFELIAMEAAAGIVPQAVPLKRESGPPPTPQVPHYWGHRERLRTRFRQGGAEALPDYELMELILFRGIPRRDVKPLAKNIIERFGSFAEAIAAAPERLLEIDGLPESAVTEIKIVQAAGLRAAQTEVKKRPLFASMSELMHYLRAAMAFEKKEEFRVLFLDMRNRLIAEEVQTRGTVNHTSVYVREIIKRALELSATAIILAHNHPAGDPTPSAADVEMTQEIYSVAKTLGVHLHDHIILGRDGHFSMKVQGLLGEAEAQGGTGSEPKKARKRE